MVAARRIIALSVDADQRRALIEIARSRTEPANCVERAGIILAYLDEPSAYAVARARRVSQQTVTQRRDPEFEPKMAEVLRVYREVEMRRAAGNAGDAAVAVVCYDAKPGIQAISTTAPDRPPVAGRHPTIGRDHEYQRHGTVTLMAGIDLLTGQVWCATNRMRMCRRMRDERRA